MDDSRVLGRAWPKRQPGGAAVGVEEPGAGTEQHRYQVQAQLVDDSRVQEVPHDRGAAGDADLLVSGGSPRLPQRGVRTVGDERVGGAARFTIGSLPRWVTTNTGAWYVGSSPHGPTPTSNIVRPVTSAPVVANRSSSKARDSSLDFPANIQSCSRPPPSPIGLSTPTRGPATKPSSDIDRST
jgi:hypothetical protein